MRHAWVLVLVTLGCSAAAERPQSESAELPEGVVARVGELEIFERTVLDIARAQKIAPRAALERAISDALFASAAADEPKLLELLPVVARSAHARALLDALREEAQNAGPPTEQEIAELTAERWAELDRPPTARTTHVVVLVKKPEEDEKARALAERIAKELAGAATTEEFEERAKAVPAEGLEVRVERLPAVAGDGRVYFPEGAPRGQERTTFDAAFAAAAVALSEPGEQSPVIRSAFGYHVLRLEERYPEQRVPLEERRSILEPEVYSRRAERTLSRLLEELKRGAKIERLRAADDLTSRVPVAP